MSLLRVSPGLLADVGGLDDPLAVEDDEGRDRLDRERVADRPARVEGDQADLRAGQARLLLVERLLDELADARRRSLGSWSWLRATMTTSLLSLA